MESSGFIGDIASTALTVLWAGVLVGWLWRGRRPSLIPLFGLLSLEALASLLAAPGLATMLQLISLALSVPVVLRLLREPDEERALRDQLRANLAVARAAEERLMLAFSATSEYLWETDLRTGVMNAAPQIGTWLGYAPEAWPPKPWHLIVHPEDRQRVLDSIAAAVADPTKRYESRHRLIHLDGKRVFHVHVTGVTTTDEHGKALRFVGAVRDVTQEVEAEHRRLQSQKLESLGLLAGGIAHDFNNLLTIISSSLEVADRVSRRGERPEEALGTAAAAIVRATTLTRQLLVYAGRGPVLQRPVDVNELVSAMSQLLAVSVPPKVKLVRELSAKLPLVKGDEGQLQQVVMNLITNAAEAIGGKEGLVRVVTCARTLDSQPPGVLGLAPLGAVVQLSVSDDGVGMSPEVQARIFDPFFSTKGTGRGLGLAALAGILKSHGGAIALESELGHGTTFSVFLPALDEQPKLERPSPGAPRTALAQRRVLVVDDEELVRRSTARLLSAFGCVVVAVDSGTAAIEQVRADPRAFDVVLMDLTMPDLDGLETSRAIRGLAPALPIVLSSGAPVTLPDLGRLSTLPKPYDSRLLEKAVSEALGSTP